MGCTSSSPKHSAGAFSVFWPTRVCACGLTGAWVAGADGEDALASAATAPISILVTGRAGCGVTSLCRRFVTKGFESPTVSMIGTGTRTVVVNETNVPVTVR